MTDKLLVSQDGHILTLTFNRPEVRNAVDPQTMQALHDAIVAAEADFSVRVVILTGTAGHFCAGADIQDAVSQVGNGQLAMADRARQTLTEVYGPTLLAIRNARFPVIAAVEGYAAGLGCDIALRCDLRLVSDNARFAELFIRVGLVPDGGGTFLLPRLVGLGRALEMMFTGRDVYAPEAYNIGLANQVYKAEEFQSSVKAYAEVLASKAPLALERGKRAMLATLEGGSSYAEALSREASLQHEIFSSEDGLEGFTAFMQKRDPVWKGR